MGQRPQLLLPILAQMEDSMIEALLIFICCFLYFGGKAFLEYLQQRDYERRKFYLLVAEELDRMDKIAEDQKEMNKPKRITQWQMRN
jgi:hypothetical protein